MSGPCEPFRSRSLSKAAAALESNVATRRLELLSRGVRTLSDDVYCTDLDGLAPIERRETRERDRSLSGKARRNARRAAGR